MQKQSCIEPCVNKHINQWWMYSQDTERTMQNKCHLTNTAYSVWKVLVWATQIKAHQGEQGATQFLASRTISCFQGLFLHFSYDQYKAALTFMKLYGTYLLPGFTNICNRLQSCSELVRNTGTCYPIYQQLSEKGWHDVWVVWNGDSSQQGSLRRVGWGSFCLFAINISFSELIQNFAISFFQMAEANFEIKLSNWKHFLLQCTISICCNGQ